MSESVFTTGSLKRAMYAGSKFVKSTGRGSQLRTRKNSQWLWRNQGSFGWSIPCPRGPHLLTKCQDTIYPFANLDLPLPAAALVAPANNGVANSSSEFCHNRFISPQWDRFIKISCFFGCSSGVGKRRTEVYCKFLFVTSFADLCEFVKCVTKSWVIRNNQVVLGFPFLGRRVVEKVVLNGYLTNESVNCKPKACRGWGLSSWKWNFVRYPAWFSFITNLNIRFKENGGGWVGGQVRLSMKSLVSIPSCGAVSIPSRGATHAREWIRKERVAIYIYLDHVTGRKSRFEFGIWSVFVSMLGTWDRVKSYSLQLSQSNIPVIRNPGAHQP